MAIFKAGSQFGVDMDALEFAPLNGGVVSLAVASTLYADLPGGDRDALFGTFSYDGAGRLAGGVLNHVQENLNGLLHFDISGFSISAATFVRSVQNGDVLQALGMALSENDTITGTHFDDRFYGFAGDDTIVGGGGYDVINGGDGNDVIRVGPAVGTGETVMRGDDGNDSLTGGDNFDDLGGGAGNDTLDGGAGKSYLRGDDGNDSVTGGASFDDINGNAGADTAHGGAGGDWVVGGKDNDLLFGDDGDDIVYGNLGADTADGGTGADLVRGGQGDDSLTGGAGNDWLSGDKGADTISGGAGADTFHASPDAGADRIVDFSAAEGDRVQMDIGAAYTSAQVGADTVITVIGGAQMTLVGVALASLSSGWIFEA